MRNFTIALTLGGCALALAACGGREEKAEETKDASPAAAMASAPSPKAGLWEETITIEGQPPQTVKRCRGENEGDLSAMGEQAAQVCKPQVTNGAGTWDIAMTCDMGTGGKIESKAKISGDMATNYTSEAVTTVSGAEVAHMNRTTKVSIASKHLGACPEGMNPGSVDVGNMIIDASGMKK